jgi:rhodanese-related sulfurtransferase
MIDVKDIPAPPEAQVHTAALAIIVRAGVPVVILDANAGAWDEGKRIPGARSLPHDSGDAEIRAAVGPGQPLIVTYCGGLLCPASGRLYRRIRDLGYENVLEYQDGIAGWMAAGLPIEEREPGR